MRVYTVSISLLFVSLGFLFRSLTGSRGVFAVWVLVPVQCFRVR